MEAYLNKIIDLSPAQKIGGLLITIAVISLGYWFLFYSDISYRITELEAEIEGQDGLQAKVSQQMRIARNLNRYLSEVAHLDAELEKALRELPDKKEMDLLLTRISDRARDSGLEVQSFKPEPEIKRSYYAEQPVSLEVRGTFHQIASFFDEVGHLKRIVNLSQFHLLNPSVTQEKVMIRGLITATAFRFLEEQERLDNEKPKAGPKRPKSKSA